VRAVLYWLLCINAWLVMSAPAASAHTLNNGYTEASIDGSRVHLEMTLSQSMFPDYDSDRDGAISTQELAEQQQLNDLFRRHFELFDAAGKLPMKQMEMSPGVQEAIPVIHFKLEFTATNRIDQLNVNYSLFIHDSDPQHQNYLTFYRDDEVVGHTVLELGHETYVLHGGKSERYTSPLWSYGVLGSRIVVDGATPLLFLLCIALCARTMDKAINAVLVMIIAHAAIMLTLCQLGLSIPSSLHGWWQIGIWAVMLSLLVGICIRQLGRRNIYMAVSAAYGLLHGLDEMTGDRPLAHAGPFSRIIIYHFGAAASMVIVMYIAYHLVCLLQAVSLVRKLMEVSKDTNERR
jgi:hypothetical protein